MLPAEGEELLLTSGAADGMEELRADPLAEEVGVFLDLLHPFGIRDAGITDRLVEIVNIGQDFVACRVGNRISLEMFSDLRKEPGVAYRSATDHQAPGTSFPQESLGIGRSGDITISQDWARK